jgi:hypothetical protein
VASVHLPTAFFKIGTTQEDVKLTKAEEPGAGREVNAGSSPPFRVTPA